MEAVTLLRDKVNNHRLMQIDLDLVAANEELLEDIHDLLTIEVRKNEKQYPGKTQRTPAGEIERAEKIKNEYYEEKKSDKS